MRRPAGGWLVLASALPPVLCYTLLHCEARSARPQPPPATCLHPQGGALSILEETELKAGKFGVIRSLLRALDGGSAAKAALDAVVDACSAMQVRVGGRRGGTRACALMQPADMCVHDSMSVAGE